MDTFQINKLSKLHDGKNIIFCKTDFLQQEFEYIKTLNNDVVLITGNSDYCISDDAVETAPKNIKKWFAQNAIGNHEKLEPIPIGFENENFCNRDGHGIGYAERVTEKERLVSSLSSIQPTKDIYCNFNLATNFNYRSKILEVCKKAPFITVDQSNLLLKDFFENVSSHRMSVCPIGNGVDTHRLWEVLYCGRIPITFKVGQFKIYDLYKQLPIIILNTPSEILDKDLIEEKYQKELEKLETTKSILDSKHWINKIKNVF